MERSLADKYIPDVRIKCKVKSLSGIDASALISLQEYGFAWREEKDGTTTFFYGIRTDEHGTYIEFDHANYDLRTLDPLREWRWVKPDYWEQYLEEMSAEGEQRELKCIPMTHIIYDLVQYYGYENVFGSTYWRGFRLSKSERSLIWVVC